jgi:hypothetical protein
VLESETVPRVAVIIVQPTKSQQLNAATPIHFFVLPFRM